MSAFEKILTHLKSGQCREFFFGHDEEVSLKEVTINESIAAYQLHLRGKDSVLIHPTPCFIDNSFKFKVVDAALDRSRFCFSESRIADWEELVYDILESQKDIERASRPYLMRLSAALDQSISHIFSLYQKKQMLIECSNNGNNDTYAVVARTAFSGTFTGKIIVHNVAGAKKVQIAAIDTQDIKTKTVGVFPFSEKSTVQDIVESELFVFPSKTLTDAQYQKLCSELYELVALKLKAVV